MIRYTTDASPREDITVRQWNFPGGEVGVDIETKIGVLDATKVNRVWVEARIQNSDDLMALILATDALKRHFLYATFALDMPYVPYGRQDRVCNPGESLSVKVMGSIINSLGYASVDVLDPHSAVTEAVIDNVRVSTQHAVFKDVHGDWSGITIVAPDQGATKKCETFAKQVGAAGVITCSKTRNLADGKITGMAVDGPSDMSHLHLLVLDDICDGGRTFIELAALLKPRNPKKLELAVTHGIFSKGFEVVGAAYDHVYTTDSFGPILPGRTLTVIEI